MKYLTIAEAAKRLKFSERRVQQMCASGEIAGAEKNGRRWLVPVGYLDGALEQGKKPLPIGVSDYKSASSNYYYVDKTLLIRDFLDRKPLVSLFTRPRRFGKTLNMDMLRVFFEKTDEDNSVYFCDKAIWSCGKAYTDYQGKYPVIFLSFKDVKCGEWSETFGMIKKLISLEFRRHIELEKSEQLSDYDKVQYSELAKGTADAVEFQLSLQTLSRLLHKHFGEKTIIIIDEYDTPIQQGYSEGFYNDVIRFMRNFFSGGLKDNSHLAYGFLTGILKVAKESIFSGLNNLTVDSVLDMQYSEYFGFTKAEVAEMLKYYGHADKFGEICEWYDGYLFGATEIFNPWSVINYISENCFPKAFWQSTGSNDIIGEIIAEANDEIMENLYDLMSGRAVTSYIDTDVIYPEVRRNPYSIYSFLLVAGYLKVSMAYPQHDGNFMCDVSIPNKEISYVYEKEILNRIGRADTAISIRQSIFASDGQKLQKLLEKFMVSSVSYHDAWNESFYHGMMLGLCAVLGDSYEIESNRESGFGRFDIALVPRKKTDPVFLFELKHAANDSDDLEKLAEEALSQISSKKYGTELVKHTQAGIRSIGIAFRGKRAVVKE